MKRCPKGFSVILLVVLLACGQEENDPALMEIFPASYDFSESEHGWQYGFADYPATEDSSLYELKYEYTTEPGDSKLTKKSLMLSGKNVNRDLFMYVKKKVSGLQPDTEYTITFNVELASNLNALTPIAAGSVYLKAGATHIEPKTVIESGSFVINVDKGNHSTPGEDLISLGDIFSEANTTGYALVTRNNTMANTRYVARTNSKGELWLIVGTDSDREGTTTIFYRKVNVVFSVS